MSQTKYFKLEKEPAIIFDVPKKRRKRLETYTSPLKKKYYYERRAALKLMLGRSNLHKWGRV